MFAGCIVGDPPELGQPQQTPPFVDTAKTDPTPGRVIQLESGDNLPLTVPYRSEDAGEDLFATLWLDYEVEGERLITFRQLPAGTLDDGERQFSTSWTVPAPLSGCHQLTFVLTHLSSMDGTKPSSEAADVATVTWWLNVGDSAEEPNLLADCPGPSGSGAMGLLSDPGETG